MAKSEKFELPLVTSFDLRDDQDNPQDRRFVQLCLPYHLFRDYFYILPYNDQKGEGFQRATEPARINKLAGAMRKGEYSPTCFMGGIEEKHEKYIRFFERDGTPYVEIEFSKAHPIPCTDGGGRRGAIGKIESDAKANEAQRQRAKNQAIPIMLMLDAGFLPTDFVNYQKSKTVSTTLLSNIEATFGQGDEKKKALYIFSKHIARILNSKERSHYYRMIGFDAVDKRQQGFQTVALGTSGNLGTSLYGGAVLCHPDHLNRNPEWMAAIYMDVWQAIKGRTERGEEGEALILEEGKMLVPYSMNGTKGASKFLVGIGNLFGWRAGHSHLEIGSTEYSELLGHLASVVDANCDRKVSWDATNLRSELHAFGREFFKDMKGDTPFLGETGLPIGLLRPFPPGNFALGKDATRLLEKELEPLPDENEGGLPTAADIVPFEPQAAEEEAKPAKRTKVLPQAKVGSGKQS